MVLQFFSFFVSFFIFFSRLLYHGVGVVFQQWYSFRIIYVRVCYFGVYAPKSQANLLFVFIIFITFVIQVFVFCFLFLPTFMIKLVVTAWLCSLVKQAFVSLNVL